jgi:hypothetical protein
MGDPISRYAAPATLTVPAPGGGTRTMGVPRTVPAPDPRPAAGYQVRDGDRLDLLGRAVTADTTGWWRIADANPFEDPTELERPGRTIRIPGA